MTAAGRPPRRVPMRPGQAEFRGTLAWRKQTPMLRPVRRIPSRRAVKRLPQPVPTCVRSSGCSGRSGCRRASSNTNLAIPGGTPTPSPLGVCPPATSVHAGLSTRHPPALFVDLQSAGGRALSGIAVQQCLPGGTPSAPCTLRSQTGQAQARRTGSGRKPGDHRDEGRRCHGFFISRHHLVVFAYEVIQNVFRIKASLARTARTFL